MRTLVPSSLCVSEEIFEMSHLGKLKSMHVQRACVVCFPGTLSHFVRQWPQLLFGDAHAPLSRYTVWGKLALGPRGGGYEARLPHDNWPGCGSWHKPTQSEWISWLLWVIPHRLDLNLVGCRLRAVIQAPGDAVILLENRSSTERAEPLTLRDESHEGMHPFWGQVILIRYFLL